MVIWTCSDESLCALRPYGSIICTLIFDRLLIVQKVWLATACHAGHKVKKIQVKNKLSKKQAALDTFLRLFKRL